MASRGRGPRRSSRKKAGGEAPAICLDAEVPDLDEDAARQRDKTRRLHELGADVAGCFAACTAAPSAGTSYIDPRIALSVLLHHLVKTNLDLVRAQGSALAKNVGVGSGAQTDDMAKQVASSFYQAADHNLRMQVRFMDMAWVSANRGRHQPIVGVGCAPVEVPDLGDPAQEAGKLKRLHELGSSVAKVFSKCTGSNPQSVDYIDPRVALSILLVYLASTNRDLVNEQGSALAGSVGRGSGTAIDDTAKNAAQRFLDEADHNVRMHVRYKSLRWVAAQKTRAAGRSGAARKSRRPR